MASRKPKGIDDQIVGGIRQIMSPWLGSPPAQNNKVTQAQGLARTAAQTLDQTFAGGMIGAGVKGNKALAKQAAVNVAALGTGYVAGKAIQTAAGAVVKSGLPQRFANTLTGQKVITIGTRAGHTTHVPTESFLKPGQSLYPKLGGEPIGRFGFDPSITPTRQMTGELRDYANKWQGQHKFDIETFPDGGTRPGNIVESYRPEIVVAKVPKKSVNYEPVMPAAYERESPQWKAQREALALLQQGSPKANPLDPSFVTGSVFATSPAKIVSRINPLSTTRGFSGAVRPINQIEADIIKAIKRAGGKVPKKR